MLVPNDSVLLIDKPLHWSSFDVIRYLKREYRRTTPPELQIKKFKIGHAGTLDPLATGLLIVCTGDKTKTIDLYQGQTKEYRARIIFGAITPSYDSEFEPTELRDTSRLTVGRIEDGLKQFIGNIGQKPPIFSALKINGEKAYDIARKNLKNSGTTTVIELKIRNITVYSFALDPSSLSTILVSNTPLPSYSFDITCSKGTYIRSLAHDLGQRVETGAYLKSLRRTKIGNFSVGNAQTIVDSQFQPSTLRV